MSHRRVSGPGDLATMGKTPGSFSVAGVAPTAALSRSLTRHSTCVMD